MEGEWTDSRLEIVGYRETGTGVLKGVDEINTVLDEQVTSVILSFDNINRVCCAILTVLGSSAWELLLRI